jgi:uroporphyrinogen-III synthase
MTLSVYRVWRKAAKPGKTMRVLVTRPLEDGEETARQLARRGHEALLAPLLATQFHPGDALSLDGVQAVLATSANGVRALIRRTDRRDLPLFAVGPQTAEEASAAGFSDVRNADGDARTLARATLDWVHPENGVLLHVRGSEGASTLAETLRRDGFTLREEVLYSVLPRPLPPQAVQALQGGTLDAALFFSPRSAGIFRDAAVQQTLPTQSLLALCISAATAAALAPLLFRDVRIAAAPNQSALLAPLENMGPQP